MSAGLAAMLLGVFVVPGALVWLGHRLRRRPPAWRGAFWGALVGHVIALALGLTFGMIPPEEWSRDDRLRGAFAFWSFLVLPLLGGAVGWLRGRRKG
jgi:RsiW-degrading membrane proteinase PrsW (M82 family)